MSIGIQKDVQVSWYSFHKFCESVCQEPKIEPKRKKSTSLAESRGCHGFDGKFWHNFCFTSSSLGSFSGWDWHHCQPELSEDSLGRLKHQKWKFAKNSGRKSAVTVGSQSTENYEGLDSWTSNYTRESLFLFVPLTFWLHLCLHFCSIPVMSTLRATTTRFLWVQMGESMVRPFHWGPQYTVRIWEYGLNGWLENGPWNCAVYRWWFCHQICHRFGWTPSSSKLSLKCNFSCGDFVLQYCELSAKDLKIGLQSCADLVSLPQKTLNNCSSTSHCLRANPVNAETEKDVPHLGLATGTNPSTKI